jgi:hypothetical protein
MATASQKKHLVIGDTAIPYRSYLDITSNTPNFVAGSNILTTSKQLMERRPGFSDNLETTPTAFTALAREFKWSKFDGTSFYSMVNDISGGVSKVYKLKIGTDTSYVLLFSSSTSAAFDFETSSNVLFFGNGTDMRAWNGSGIPIHGGLHGQRLQYQSRLRVRGFRLMREDGITVHLLGFGGWA